jgi:hypothetical protein
MTAHHDLRLRTSLPYERVENMLTSACSKVYSMTLDGIEETKSGPRKVIRISFEDPADRERFRITFQKARDSAVPDAAALRLSTPKPQPPAA